MTLPVVRGLPALDRTLVMGVLNVTLDSFSDGGRYIDQDRAIAHGHALAGAGADLVDVGGESTRPGAARVEPDVEAERVLPVVRALVGAGIMVSVDTTRATLAEAALDLGATVINDVSGGLADPSMFKVMAEVDAPYVLMHWRGHSSDMQSRAVYDDVVREVTNELRGRLDAAQAAGIAIDRIVLDPGIGFAKAPEHNWRLLGALDRLDALGRPLLIGVSRKAFLGKLLAGDDGEPRPVDQREDATTALSALLAAQGIWGIRVHEVPAARDAVRVAAAVRAGRSAT